MKKTIFSTKLTKIGLRIRVLLRIIIKVVKKKININNLIFFILEVSLLVSASICKHCDHLNLNFCTYICPVS
jgi:hypothetical protein